MKKVVIIGAGPAGITAGYELLKNSNEYEVIILEASSQIGGISKTVNYNGNRMDMGGHRFFSKVEKVNEWWDGMLPLQGAPAYDDKLLDRSCNLMKGGADPEKTDVVMLRRNRVSRIYFEEKFYDYPISMKLETFTNMGFWNSVRCGFSYLAAQIRKLPEDNLENFYINRFGRRLYEMFFEYYTENLWGRHPKDIDSSWGRQRVKGLSLAAVIKDVFTRKFFSKKRKVETSLINEFSYPKYGPGQLWETAANEFTRMGGKILFESEVKALKQDENGSICAVQYQSNHILQEFRPDIVISSMPIRDLVLGMEGVPGHLMKIAEGLPYRDYMTVGVLVDHIELANTTKLKTVGNIIPDCWIYIQDRSVKMGRVQIYNNWSPYLVKDIENTVWVGLEYFVQEGDDFWEMDDESFSDFALREMISLGLIRNKNGVIDTHVERVKKAYPAYFDTYNDIGELVDYLVSIPNLYCIGRNGQHRYNNMDHSMCTAFETVDCILDAKKDKRAAWAVNTEEEYHENAATYPPPRRVLFPG